MLKSDKIYLRAPEPSDVDLIFRWENDAEAWTEGRYRAPLSRHAIWQYVENYSPDIFAVGEGRFMICRSDDNSPVGALDIYEFDAINRRAGIGIYVDDRQRGKSVATEAINLFIDYCRRDLGLHQLWAVVSVANIASRALFKKMNFKECGRLRSWVRCGDHFTDALICQRLLVE